MNLSKPGDWEKLMAIKVNINTSYKLGTSWVRVCVHKKKNKKKNKSLVRRRESLLSLRLVAMISRCFLCPVVSMQHPIFFVLFYLYSKCRWWRKVLHFFRRLRIVKNVTFQWTQSNHSSWNHYQNRATR